MSELARLSSEGSCLARDLTRHPRPSLSPIVSTHVVSPTTTQLVHFQSSPRFPASEDSKVRIPRELLTSNDIRTGKQLRVRGDLESLGVEVCSFEEVPPLFTENFDYQSIRPDFVVGILTSDLLGKTISCEVVGEGRSDEWGILVSDTRSYDLAR